MDSVFGALQTTHEVPSEAQSSTPFFCFWTQANGHHVIIVWYKLVLIVYYKSILGLTYKHLTCLTGVVSVVEETGEEVLGQQLLLRCMTCLLYTSDAAGA